VTTTPSGSAFPETERAAVSARRLDNTLDSVTLVVAAGLLVLALLRVESPVRVVMASGFTLFAPGWAIVTHWDALRQRTRFGASIVLSLSLLTLFAIVSVWIHEWHPVILMEIEAGAVIAAVVAGNLRR
jgi:uncharacterized membrane protein